MWHDVHVRPHPRAAPSQSSRGLRRGQCGAPPGGDCGTLRRRLRARSAARGIFVGAGALDKFVPICSIEASTKIVAALKSIEAQRVARISPRRIPVARPNKTGRNPALTLRVYCHATEADDANAATLIASIFQSLQQSGSNVGSRLCCNEFHQETSRPKMTAFLTFRSSAIRRADAAWQSRAARNGRFPTSAGRACRQTSRT